MDKQFIEDLVANAQVDSVFAVKDRSLIAFRNKPGKFMSITLADATGEMTGRVWDHAEELAEGFDVGDAVAVVGAVDEYQGKLQIICSKIAKAEDGSYDVGDLVARAGRSREELLTWLDETVAEVQDPHLSALLKAFFQEPGFRVRFADAVGARSLHHAYAGGLLEHTLSVVHILDSVAQIHPELNRDLLIAGGLLHDIGKLEELSGLLATEYTDIGKFIGHTVIADRMLNAAMDQIDGFPDHLKVLLSHMLLSHHGEREWGAPIVPATMEACALHYADNLDARVQGFKQVIQANAGGERSWSDYHRSYERQIYLGPREAPEPEETQDPPAGTRKTDGAGPSGPANGQLAL